MWQITFDNSQFKSSDVGSQMSNKSYNFLTRVKLKSNKCAPQLSGKPRSGCCLVSVGCRGDYTCYSLKQFKLLVLAEFYTGSKF